MISNPAIARGAIFGVRRLDGDRTVIVGVPAAAFIAVRSMTTAYLGIRAVSGTAGSIAPGKGGTPRQQAPTAATGRRAP
ncbi:hypothetical protein [Streptomyces sp. NBC_00078]|uniref:hypothetical protein n=1 Tax=unclassified Streptomyces TaxID=2593676 RepID=UPI00224F5517|nr:hypothetical protein [Streptomyces sp. NBC_00078]MCX5421908.1 hypothetical protein [Streptomyces sp. NBC_00078]